MGATVTLTERAARAAKRGRAWFFADDLKGTDAEHGDLVTIRSDGGGRFGPGLYALEPARIRLRRCFGAVPDGAAVGEFLSGRIRAAIDRRAGLRGAGRAARLVHAEADGLPGLVVDEFADHLVVQISAAALAVHEAEIVDALRAAVKPRAIVARHDIAVRELEGLPRGVEVLHGEPAETVEFEEHGVIHVARPRSGHKTGFYLDQREARGLVRRVADGRRVLDLFAYQGGFSLAALRGGATSALAVDQSAPALATAEALAERNDLRGLETRAANAFDVLRELREAGESFDLVVLDPPPFAKSRKELAGAKRGYRDLNRHAMRVLAPGGLLLTCSCSHHVTPPIFEDLLRQAAVGARGQIVLRERLMAGADHPASITLPESEYLKSCLLERIEFDR